MRTEFEFVLPRGYVEEDGTVHRRGIMRLATARDELEPLRDPTILGPDDPRLTIVVLSRVVRSLGTLPMVTRHEIEGLFAADLAYLQDFYGVINFGTEDDIDALLGAQDVGAAGEAEAAAPAPAAVTQAPAPGAANAPGAQASSGAATIPPPVAPRPVSRRGAVEEVSSTRR